MKNENGAQRRAFGQKSDVGRGGIRRKYAARLVGTGGLEYPEAETERSHANDHYAKPNLHKRDAILVSYPTANTPAMSTQKIKSVDEAARLAHECHSAGKRVVLTNGCFDILHPGHVDLFDRARREGDVLVVALNSDTSVRRLKGNKRPILGQDERAEIVAAMEAVDLVCVFDEDTPLAAILKIHPDVLVKGADWEVRGIVGQREVESWGGKVVVLGLVDGQSTTGIVNRVVERLS